MRPLALLGLLGVVGCDVVIKRGDAQGDSARPAPDTVVRVDTVTVVDTVWALRDSLWGIDRNELVPLPPAGAAAVDSAPVAPPAPAPLPPPPGGGSDVDALRARRLLLPVQGVAASALRDNFAEARGGGTRTHEALDIMAPRGTPVLSADDGRVAKLFTSKAGGLTVYVASPDGRFMLYYAHLDRYRDGLTEGAAVRKGDVLGYVGSTGDASPNAPHLHFAIARVADPKQWWTGTPINPYPLFAP